MWARIAANFRMFLVKIKSRRDEPLNERKDDLTDEGKTLAKAGDTYQWTNRTISLRGSSRRDLIFTRNILKFTAIHLSAKWRTELFKPRLELWEGEQIEPVGRQRSGRQ